MVTKLYQPPACTPVSLVEAKAQLYVTHTADDGLISGIVRAATNRAEQFTGRKFVYRKSIAYFDGFPCARYRRSCRDLYDTGEFRLPFGWLVGVDGIRYRLLSGEWTTLDASRYIVDTDSEPGRVVLPDGGEWPTDDLYPVNPVEITFSHGRKFGPVWSQHTAVLGELVRSEATGWVYECVTAGATGATEPAWVGATITDGSAEWEPVNETIPQEIRQAILVWVTDHYESRGTMVDLQQQKFKTAELLLQFHKVFLV